MTEWVRVKDKDTKHEYSVRADLVTDAHEVLKKPAADRNDLPLPAKNHRELDSLPGTVADLQEYASKNGIDLGEATKKADIQALILASEDAEANPADNHDGQEAN